MRSLALNQSWLSWMVFLDGVGLVLVLALALDVLGRGVHLLWCAILLGCFFNFLLVLCQMQQKVENELNRKMK
jgi:hypothetical protein